MQSLVAGIDEAVRGPLAGPVTAGCVILPPDFPVEMLNDSKKLSEKKRIAAEERAKAEAEKEAERQAHREQILEELKAEGKLK